MWIPRPIYEALPALYIVIGVAMISLLVYLADASLQAILYGAIAGACLAAGPAVHRMRASVRQNGSGALQDEDVERSPQTGKTAT